MFMQQFFDSLIPYLLPAQIACLVIVTILILVQNRGSGLSSSFGGSNEIYLTRRGIEKWVINFTVILLILFVVLRILNLYV